MNVRLCRTVRLPIRRGGERRDDAVPVLWVDDDHHGQLGAGSTGPGEHGDRIDNGVVAMAIANAHGMVFGDKVGASATAFFVGFIAGVVLAFTLLTLISSAINTVIVCIAEAPPEFELNHIKLSQDMRSAWREAWPEEFRY